MRPIDPCHASGRPRLTRALWLTTAVVLLVGVATPVLADVYKWLDPQGRVHYSDRPPPADAKLLSVESGAGTHHAERAPPAPAAAPALRAAAPAPLPPGTPQEMARLKQSVDTDVSATRAAQCKTAQEHYQGYVNSRRIFKEGANKERIYLTDAEADAERVNARRDVEELCGDAAH